MVARRNEVGGSRARAQAVGAPMARLAKALAVGTGLVTLAACGSSAPSVASVQADQSFLAAVHSNAPDIASYRSDVAVIRLGHAACDGFRGGVTFQQLADRLILIEGSHPVPTSDLGAVVTAAVTSYCPQYGELVR